MWEEKLLHNGVRKEKTEATRNTCLVANRSSFLWSGGKREATKSEATRWKHSSGSCYLSSYTATFVSPFLFLFFFLIQKPDAHPRRRYETLSAGKFRSDKRGTGHSHLILKEALVERSTSPVVGFSATHTKFPASSCRSTAVNLRLLPSWKRRSLFSSRWPL